MIIKFTCVFFILITFKEIAGSSIYQIGLNCHYHGKMFNIGENWTALDGCNKCSCHSGKLVVRMTCTEESCGQTGQCTYHGKTYNHGESFLSFDKCNSCTCTSTGIVACTERLCLLNGNSQNGQLINVKRSSVWQHGRRCYYDNRYFNLGESWTAFDGCNTCSCYAGDILVRRVCTENKCASPVKDGQCMYYGHVYNKGDSFKSVDKCNTCHCSDNGAIGCTEMACLIHNERESPISQSERSSVWQRGFKCHYDNKQYGIGESWTATDGCNTCSCHAGDLIVRLVCTEKPCPTQLVSDGQCMYYGHVYNKGDSFKSVDKCNTCHCSDNGAISCTEMACLIHNERESPISQSERSSVWQRGFKCHYDNKQYGIGESWTATDGCNTCSCHAGDLIVRLVCTEKPCPTQLVSDGQCMYYGHVYNKGDSFKSVDKCNTCHCSDNGAISCTEMACLIHNERESPISQSERSSVWQRGFKCHYDNKQYGIGESWTATDGCNTCSCHAGDLIVRLVCTEKPCPTQLVSDGQCSYHGKMYKTGDSFQSYDKCNQCFCSRGGIVACTERFCLIDGKKRNVPMTGNHCVYDGRVYKGGDSFPSQDKCNTCYCGTTRGVYCTEMACLPNQHGH